MKCPKCDSVNPDTVKFCGECGTDITHPEEAQPSITKTIETPREELTRGTLFADRYEIIEELGKGGMGAVYRVEDTKAKEEIALKLIKPEIAGDRKTIERFRNELKIARKIRQKNVCAMYELMEEEGRYFITMEYISGQDLKGLIRQTGQLTVGKTVSIAKQICQGLAEAHSLGVVHRDLKPSNIMIDRGGNARIMDFGIARAVKAKSITGPGVMIGTPQYMSPEQVAGKEVDHRSDLYSLGIILYEMLTDQLPFEGDTPLTIGVKQKTERPKDPKNLNERIQDDLNRLIMKCLEKERENRYQSTHEVQSELEKIERGIPTSDREIQKKKTLTSHEITVRLNLRKLVLPSIIGLALVAIGLILWTPRTKKEIAPMQSDMPSVAVMYFKNNTGDEDLDHWETGLSDSIIQDLSQSKFIKVLSTDRLYSILRKLNLLDSTNYATEDLKVVAAEGGVTYILLGRLSKSGETFRIDYTLQDIYQEKTIGSEKVEEKGEENIFTMVDELTIKVKQNFNFTLEQLADDVDSKAGIITTSSAEAYYYYSEGRKYHKRNDYTNAILNYKRAVEIDPEFAIAYRYLSTSSSSIGYFARGIEYMKKALELSDRLSERERLQIQGKIDIRDGKRDKAIEAYLKILETYPDDLITHHNLGTSYNSIGEMDKAIEILNKSIFQYKTDIFPSFILLADIYESQGRTEKAQEVFQIYMQNYGDHPTLHKRKAHDLRRQGDYDLALMEIENAISLNPDDFLLVRDKAEIYIYRGDLVKAEAEYQKLLRYEDPIIRSQGLMGLAEMSLLQGKFKASKTSATDGLKLAESVGENIWMIRWYFLLHYIEAVSNNYEQALAEINKAWELSIEENDFDNKIRSLYLMGLFELKWDNKTKAQNASVEIEKLCEQEKRDLPATYFHLVGEIALKNNNQNKAVEYTEKALSTSNFLPFLDSLARAQFIMGALETARITYERIGSLSTSRIQTDFPDSGDMYAKSFYNLGMIYERLGDTTKAIENYEKFLDLWKDADPGLPEVADARERVAVLRN